MVKYLSKVNSWLRCLVSLLPAVGVAALLCFLLEGPRLGSFYDFLLRQRRAPLASREILIIDSTVPEQGLGNDILEPGALSSLLYTLAELGAGTLIIQVPILGLSVGGPAGESEILYRFDEEFSILSGNIRNLFDGIRTGSVAPYDSARYVGELVELSERGKERLVSALVRRDEEGIIAMERAAAFFGNARRPGDLRVQLIRAGESGQPAALEEIGTYSKAPTDRGWVLRRVAPRVTVPDISEGADKEKTLEHIIFKTLKTRYESTEIEYIDTSGVRADWMLYPMVLALRTGPDGRDTILPLDRNGALLFEAPRKSDDFRRIDFSVFLTYEEADKELRRLISEGEYLGIFRDIDGENRPGFLYDFALSLREELAVLLSTSPGDDGEDMKRLWIELRNRYFASLEAFINGPAEAAMLEASGEMPGQDSVIRIFSALREKHNEVMQLRTHLEYALYSSFCILGSSTDTEASALLANSILTGMVVMPGENFYLLSASLFWACLTCVFIKALTPLATLRRGSLFVLFIGFCFSLGFILSGIWFNPLVPTASSATGVLVSFSWAVIAKYRFNRRFSLAYGPYISRPCLKSVILAGRPLPSQVLTTKAAVIAIEYIDAAVAGDQQAKAFLDFQRKVSVLSKKAGGVITGVEGNLVTACFGSPLDRVFFRDDTKASTYENNISAPVLRAVDFVSALVSQPECESWYFGLDMGSCAFAWTNLSGYSAMGEPVQRARILSRMANRYKVRIVISEPVCEALPDLLVKKLGIIKGKNNDEGEPFFRLTVIG